MQCCFNKVEMKILRTVTAQGWNLVINAIRTSQIYENSRMVTRNFRLANIKVESSSYFSTITATPTAELTAQENGKESGEGKEYKEADPGSPKKCDTIIISGRQEKCEAAKEALQVSEIDAGSAVSCKTFSFALQAPVK